MSVKIAGITIAAILALITVAVVFAQELTEVGKLPVERDVWCEDTNGDGVCDITHLMMETPKSHLQITI